MLSTLSTAPWAQLLLLFSVALPVHAKPTSTCQNPVVRKEWRTLNDAEKLSYIAAVKCIGSKPNLTPTSYHPAVRNHNDDYVAIHQKHTPKIHFTGIFYPWHRLFVKAYEEALHECGWSDGQPWWDWRLDSGSSSDFYNSPLFDATTGFGGNGAFVPGNSTNLAPGMDRVDTNLTDAPDRTGGGCITDGPFANTTVNLGPLYAQEYNPRCIRRDFSYTWFTNGSASVVADAMALPTFEQFGPTTEGGFHLSVHVGVGGIYGNVRDFACSPNDPLFYFHHATLDLAWWSWQSRDLENRLVDITGPLEPRDNANQIAGNATLSTLLDIGTDTAVTTPVGDVMDIRGAAMCYTYDSLF